MVWTTEIWFALHSTDTVMCWSFHAIVVSVIHVILGVIGIRANIFFQSALVFFQSPPTTTLKLKLT